MASASVIVTPMKRIERIRPYPTPHQQSTLRFMLDVTRQLHNACCSNGRRLPPARSWPREPRSIRRTHRATPRGCASRRSIASAKTRGTASLGSIRRRCFRAAQRRRNRRVPAVQTGGWLAPAELPTGDRALRLDEGQTRLRVPGVGSVKLRSMTRQKEASALCLRSSEQAAGGPSRATTCGTVARGKGF